MRLELSTTTYKENKNYTESELEAISFGYTEIKDSRAYNGRYFIKNGKKWIHNLGALRKKLNKEYLRYIDDEELSASSPEGFGYDIENYYFRHREHSISNKHNFKSLLATIKLN